MKNLKPAVHLGLLFLILLVGTSLGVCAAPDNNGEGTVEIKYKGKKYTGKLIAWDGRDMVLLRRDGRVTIFPVKNASEIKQISDEFVPLSRSMIRKNLTKEFGRKYQVSVTRNFIVVHPVGDAAKWADPFQKLYQRFRIYFGSRGFTVDEPEFPMIAVVLRTRGEFDRFLKSYHDYSKDILGYYSPRSNRIITFDQSDGNSEDQGWFFSASTIIHEATHQTAFNTGIHNRFGQVPRWISEGLAMMFEAPGVNNSRYYSEQEKRVNRERLISLKHFYNEEKVDGRWLEMISSDNLFREDPGLAYAMAWGLTFYLAESNPSQFFKFLKNDARREDFEVLEPQDRRKDFAKYFGKDANDLEARIEKFIENLEIPGG
jgi:hypothetical protein